MHAYQRAEPGRFQLGEGTSERSYDTAFDDVVVDEPASVN
jgi:hypothetical protein